MAQEFTAVAATADQLQQAAWQTHHLCGVASEIADIMVVNASRRNARPIADLILAHLIQRGLLAAAPSLTNTDDKGRLG